MRTLTDEINRRGVRICFQKPILLTLLQKKDCILEAGGGCKGVTFRILIRSFYDAPIHTIAVLRVDPLNVYSISVTDLMEIDMNRFSVAAINNGKIFVCRAGRDVYAFSAVYE